MEVQLIDSMGTDLTVVNAARVSYAKQSELVWEEEDKKLGIHKQTISERDQKLIKFLANHDHWSPFAHCSLQFRIKAPIFVARQLVKHQVGLSWNEISRRYVDYEPEFYTPDTWRGRPLNSKQGSDGEVSVDNGKYDNMMSQLKLFYETLLNQGVAPEMARMVLPQSMMTEWYWSGTLYAFARVCELRCAKDTQEETTKIADKIDELCKEKFPYSWKYLRNKD